MALNVQWRWSMPQVGNPDAVAAGNRQDFLSGLDSIAAGLQKRGENERADAKQAFFELMQRQQFDRQKQQDLVNQMNTNRNYMLQRDQFDQNKARQDFEMERQRQQDAWRQKMYDTYFGNDPVEQEYQKLLAELKEQKQDNQAQQVMMGFNTLLGNLR